MSDIDELNELTEFDEELLGNVAKYMVFPLRGTRTDLHHWVGSIQDLGADLNKFLLHEAAHWPFGKVMIEARWMIERWQAENKRYYERQGIIWRMGGKITDRLKEGKGNVVKYPSNRRVKPTR